MGIGQVLSALINRAMDTLQNPIEKLVAKVSRKLSSNIQDAKVLKGKAVDTAPARAGTKLSYESFRLQHGLAPPVPLPDYAPDAIAENLAQCLAKGAWAKKVVNETYACDQLGHDMKFRYEDMVAAVEELTGEMTNVVVDKFVPKPESSKKPLWDGGEMPTERLPKQALQTTQTTVEQPATTTSTASQAPARKPEVLTEEEKYMCKALGTCL